MVAELPGRLGPASGEKVLQCGGLVESSDEGRTHPGDLGLCHLLE